MKKRIFISIPSLNIGGAETALIGMLQIFDYTKVDVDLFMYSHEGPFIQFVPKQVNVLPEVLAYAMTYRGNEKVCLKLGLYRLAWRMLKARVRLKFYVWRNKPRTYDAIYSYQGDELTKALPDINPGLKYDLAISFVVPHSYVLDHVKARKHVGWVHTDYTYIDVNRRLEMPVWNRLDKIVAISDDVTRTFTLAFPTLKDKLIKIENILSSEFVRKRAKEFVPDEYSACKKNGDVVLCTIGRVCYQKNMENIPKMAKILTGLGVSFKWFIIGPGDASQIKESIRELIVGEYVICLGPRNNPYPYIQHCDIYVQPSRYEGKAVVVREAQALGTPVVITDYPTSSSQVQNGKDGVIVHLDNEAIAKGIAGLLADKEKYKSIQAYLQSHDYSNESEIEKVYKLLA